MKKSAFLFVFVFTLFACGKKQAVIKEIDINKFEEQAPSLVNQQVSIQGMVVHTCKHGGKKMFIIGDNPEKKIMVFAGESISEFPSDLEGKRIKVIGLLKEEIITEDTIKQWEAEDKAADTIAKAEEKSIQVNAPEAKAVDPKKVVKGKVENVEVKDTAKSELLNESAEHKEGQCEDDKYAEIRKKIAESKDGKYRRYWIEATRFEEIKQ